MIVHTKMTRTRVCKDRLRLKAGYSRGKSKPIEAIWYFFKVFFFKSALPWPSSLKVKILKLFGAKIGRGLCIKPCVNIHMPWRLEIGDFVSIGEEVFILNFEKVTIGDQATLSQRAFICCGNHDFRDPRFPYRNAPITISEGAWVGASVFVGPGVQIGVDAVVSAGTVVTYDLAPNRVYRGDPCIEVGVRWK